MASTKTYLLAGLVVTVMAAAGIAAQAHGGGRFLKGMDQDGDGAISLAEATAARDRHFDRLDADGDGMISRTEFAARSDRFFAAADSDGDGLVTQEELRQHRKEWKEDAE